MNLTRPSTKALDQGLYPRGGRWGAAVSGSSSSMVVPAQSALRT
jgi:hypothetical protein